MITKAIDIKFRCSSLGHIMSEPKLKSEILSDGCKTHLVDVFVSAFYKRREEAQGKMLDKGNEREEDSITLLSRVSKRVFFKNDIRLENSFITGEPDLYLGQSIHKADETLDTKTSWSAHTFFRALIKKLDSNYEWQGMGYMDLTGAKKHTVAFCLVNGTARAILDEKRKLGYFMGILDPTVKNDKFKQGCRQIEINHIFDMQHFAQEYPGFDFDSDLAAWNYDIPMEARLHTFEILRNDIAIEKIYNRIQSCRHWMDMHLFTRSAIKSLQPHQPNP